MTRKKSELRRVLLAINESSSLEELWAAVREHLADENIELVAVFVNDDRWRRAATLPFTREIARVGGGSSDFTPQRATQVGDEVLNKIQGTLQQLAAGVQVKLAFQILEEHEIARIHEFLSSESDLLIASAFFKGQPVYAELTRLKCRLLLIDSDEVTSNEESS